MAQPAPAQPVRARANDRMLSLIMGGVALLVVAALWGWSRFASSATVERPRPAWLGITRVIAQLNDGRMLKVRVDLHLADQDAVKALTPHQDAIKAMVEEVSGDMSQEDVEGTNAMPILARELRATVNHYLASQRLPQRVRGVMFDEWTLLPS